MRAPLVLFALLLAPVASASAPAGMTVEGHVVINDAPAANGTLVSVFAGENGPWAQTRTDADGNYSLVVPADDLQTTPREGAQEGEPLRFVVLGGSQNGPGFASGVRVTVDVALALPSLRVNVTDVQPASPREGQNVTLTLAIANRGLVSAEGISIAALSGGRIVGSGGTGEMRAGEDRNVTLIVQTAGMRGDTTLAISAVARNGDADPAAQRAQITLRVIADPGPAIASVALTPAAPRAGEPIRVDAQASDARGIAWLAVHWRAADGDHEQNFTAAPYAATLGPFAAGPLRVWVAARAVGGGINESAPLDVTVGALAPTPGEPHAKPAPGPEFSALAVAALASLMILRAAKRK